MRIGFFTDTYLPKPFGIETSIETFRESLEKEKHQVFIFAPYTPGYKDKNPHVFRFSSLTIHEKRGDRLALPIVHNGELSKIVDFPLDIVHAHTPYTMGFLARFVANHQKIPLVYTHHSDHQNYLKQYIPEKSVIPYVVNSYIASFANNADLVIVPSLKITEVLRENGVKVPIASLPTGINLDLFKITKASKESAKKIRARLKIPSNGKILLVIGRIEESKNNDFLLEIFRIIFQKKNCQDAFLLFVGDGPYLQKLKKHAKNLQVAQRCIFAGLVPHNEIPLYCQASDIYLIASLVESQGIRVLEAAASGLPIVALKDKAFSEMIVEGKNGFLTPHNKLFAFAQAVEKLLENPALYSRFSAASLRISKNLSREKQAEKLIQLYKKALQKHASL